MGGREPREKGGEEHVRGVGCEVGKSYCDQLYEALYSNAPQILQLFLFVRQCSSHTSPHTCSSISQVTVNVMMMQHSQSIVHAQGSAGKNPVDGKGRVLAFYVSTQDDNLPQIEHVLLHRTITYHN